MTVLASLNQNFAMEGLLDFSLSPEGAVIANIDNDFASAKISISGGHLLTWQPKDQAQPVIWLSEQAKVIQGKSIRGGIPICWPWFGAHSDNSSFPGHGYARTANWLVTETAALASGETSIELTLEENEKYESFWPYATPLTLRITIGQHLKIALTTQNDSADSITITEALHSYFHISDISKVNVTGLENCQYLDKVENFSTNTQKDAIHFNSETDRVYINTQAECVINDPELQRRIYIAKSASASTIVWTPWENKANAMGDLGDNAGWRRMLCVESANALDNAVTIKSGESHSLSIEYWAEAM